MLDIFIQIVLAIFLILIMGFIAYSIFDREYVNSIKIFNTNKHDTYIFKGIYEFDSPMGVVETFNKDSPYYKDLNPSVNQNGGAEYSYNFWLYYNIKDFDNFLIDNTADKQKYIVLFYKGVDNKEVIDYAIRLVNEVDGNADELIEVAISLSKY